MRSLPYLCEILTTSKIAFLFSEHWKKEEPVEQLSCLQGYAPVGDVFTPGKLEQDFEATIDKMARNHSAATLKPKSRRKRPKTILSALLEELNLDKGIKYDWVGHKLNARLGFSVPQVLKRFARISGQAFFFPWFMHCDQVFSF